MVTPLRTVALLAGALVLASGSAYAGSTIARNSVASPQVVDNSIQGRDVADGTLRGKDLAPGTTSQTYTFIGSVPEGTTRVLTIPGFSRFDASCSGASDGITVSFGDADPAAGDPLQQHGIALSDITDNAPVGAATVTSWAGGVGFGNSGGSQPGAGVITRGDYWGRSRTLLAHGTISLSYPSVPCLVRVQVVVQRLTAPDPIVLRGAAARRGSACEASGAAFCRDTPAGG